MRLPSLLVLAVVAGPVLPHPGAAQAAPDTTVTITGVVFDSLISSAPMQGAEVWVEGTNRTARTDARGRFEITGLPPGRHVLTFYHVLLDSTRLSAPPVAVMTTAGMPATVVLTTPSPAAVHRALCPQDPRRAVGVVMGLVRGQPAGQALVDVEVKAEWTAFVFGGGVSKQEVRYAAARSDSSGRVVLCGVPTDVAILIRGQVPGGPSGMLALDLAGRPFARADLQLVSGGVTGTVMGVVRNVNGSLIPRATIVASGTDSKTEADDYGRFTMGYVPAGSRIVEARAIGYRPSRVQTTVVPGDVARLEIVMGDSIQVLDPLDVSAGYVPYLAKVGFEKRRETSMGHFLDDADIERTGATRFEEIFRLVPGVTLRPQGMGFIIELQRGQGQVLNPVLANYCPPSYYIDGVYFMLPPNETLNLPLVPEEILGIEVFSNLFSAPPQFQRRDSGCGIILIWTKRGVPNKPS
jgi:hypothetical protein